MYFDFEDYHPDIETVGRAISWREGILLSIIVHLLTVILILLSPKWMPKWLESRPVQPIVLRQPPKEQTRFVFVQPRVERPVAKAPDRAEASDRDRQSAAVDARRELPESRRNRRTVRSGDSVRHQRRRVRTVAESLHRAAAAQLVRDPAVRSDAGDEGARRDHLQRP